MGPKGAQSGSPRHHGTAAVLGRLHRNGLAHDGASVGQDLQLGHGSTARRGSLLGTHGG